MKKISAILIAAFLGVAFLVHPPSGDGQQNSGPTPKRWEYKTIGVFEFRPGRRTQDEELAECGKQGWELVTVVIEPKKPSGPNDFSGVTSEKYYYLKRPL